MSLANRVADTYGTRNPYTICEEIGIPIIKTYLDNGLRGCIQKVYNRYVILIHDQLPEHIQEFICAHELGHYYHHRGINTMLCDGEYNKGVYEKRADCFACQLLFGVRPLYESDVTMSYWQIAECLRISVEDVQDRLIGYGIYPYYID